MRLFRIVFFIILCITLLTGCVVERPVSPIEFYQLIQKSKDFLLFCLFLSTQENPYFSQIISRLYYSYFHLARIVHIGKTDLFEKEKHSIAWQQNKKGVRKSFGSDLKRLRIRYDYDIDSVNEDHDVTKANIEKVIEDSKNLQELIIDAKKQTDKFYRHENDANKWINDCNILFDDIERIHNDLINALGNSLNK